MSKAQRACIDFMNRSIVVTIILATFIASLAVDVQGCIFLFVFILAIGLLLGAFPYVIATLLTWIVASTK